MATIIQSHKTEQSTDTYPFASHVSANSSSTAVDLEAQNQQFQLHISQVLQTSLELDDILKLFYRELNKLTGIDSLGYRNEKFLSSLNLGTSGKHSCHYSLQINNNNLGDLILTRNQRFSPADLQFIESLIGGLVCPIRNALLYKEALQAALKDSLTQVGNRVAFDTTIDREVSLAQRHQHPLSLLVVDIDYFKKINDQFGHSTGDTALTSIAKTLMECCRETDACYRYGGEEFVIILNQTDAMGSYMIGERIRQAIESNKITSGDDSIQLTVSIGAATLREGESPSSLFNRADTALYDAKESGRNRVSLS